ncbi:histidinol dehydrogenase [Chloroflexota bacterium]
MNSVSPVLKERLRAIFGVEIEPEPAVRRIIADVRDRGDAALFVYSLKIDGVEFTSLEVSGEQITNAYSLVTEELISALRFAAERIRSFHSAQKSAIWREASQPDVGWLIRPLQRVGVYAPGGTACYPSSVLMTAIPAKVAGVEEVVLVTPPGPEAAVPAPTLVAADIAGVSRVFCVGGAQAIAALAYGTESIPRVDKICGPGNIFVVLAKKLVYGAVDIDGLQGPSEVVIVADETADPGYCAADLLAQAEHDSLASAILITTSSRLADAVNQEVERQVAGLPRKAVIAEAIEQRGMIVVVDTIEEALELVNLYAPEHLWLMVKNAATYIDKVANAGAVFVGQNSTVVLGDYVAGPSHVLPTGGTARFSSPLNVSSFIKFINLVNMSEVGLIQLAHAASTIARVEGFDAHVQAIERRLGTTE